MRPFVLALFASLALTGAASALPTGDPATVFARCEGRMGAALAFGWLDGQHDDRTERMQDTFADLRDAASSGAEGSATRRDQRIRARADQARLLQDARFHPDPRHRRVAAATAQAHRRSCEALVLG